MKYRIDEVSNRVIRLTDDGEYCGHVFLPSMKSKEKLIKSLRASGRAVIDTYLIARDECIDRGLLPDAED